MSTFIDLLIFMHSFVACSAAVLYVVALQLFLFFQIREFVIFRSITVIHQTVFYVQVGEWVSIIVVRIFIQ